MGRTSSATRRGRHRARVTHGDAGGEKVGGWVGCGGAGWIGKILIKTHRALGCMYMCMYNIFIYLMYLLYIYINIVFLEI